MKLSKESFKLLILFYAANIDGQLHSNELKTIAKKASDQETFENSLEQFRHMGDTEILDCIREHKTLYAATETDRREILDELLSLIRSDEKQSAMEKRLYATVEKLLKTK